MLAIVLAILKGIAWVLLGIVLVLFFLIALILASPFKYDVIGKQIGDGTEEFEGEFDVSWIFGAIHVWGMYQEEKPDVHIKLFGIPILEKKKKKKKKRKKGKKPPQKKPRPKQPRPENPKELAEDITKKEASKKEPPKPEKKQAVPETMKPKTPAKRIPVAEIEEVKPTKEEEAAEKAKRKAEKKEEWAEKQEGLLDKKDMFLKYWTLFESIEDKKKIFLAAKKLLVRLLKGIVPKEMFIKGTVGMGEPELTGYILALAGVLVGKFGNHIAIKGDFTKFVIEDMRLQICGRIVFGKLVYALLAFVLTKPVWKMIWKIRKGLVE